MLLASILRLLFVFFAYVIPAYKCYKAVERSKLDTAELRNWCQYWLIIAILTAVERFVEPILCWVPLYYEAKLAFVIYLWCPKTEGTAYVYETFVKPVVAQQEPEVDRWVVKLSGEVKAKAKQYWNHARAFGEESITRMLRYANMESQGRQNVVQEPMPMVEEPAEETESEAEYHVVEQPDVIPHSSPRSWSVVPSFLRFRGR